MTNGLDDLFDAGDWVRQLAARIDLDSPDYIGEWLAHCRSMSPEHQAELLSQCITYLEARGIDPYE
jgi:hypothetical protein